VRVVDEQFGNKEKFIELFNKTRTLILSMDPSFPRVELSDDEPAIQHDFFGGEYARFTDQGMAAIALVAKSEGIRLEGTYTGKAMAAFIDHVRSHGKKDEVILFWNTYNARDFSDAIQGIDYHQLPPGFHRYFEEAVQPLDKPHSE
jgi:D-cysteine desulfhydrase